MGDRSSRGTPTSPLLPLLLTTMTCTDGCEMTLPPAVPAMLLTLLLLVSGLSLLLLLLRCRCR